MVFYNYILYHCHFSCHRLLSFLHFYNLPDQAVWAILVFILVVIPEILSLFIHFYLDIFIPVMCLDKAFNIELKAVSFYCFFPPLSVWNSAGHLTNYEFFTKRKCKDDSNRLIYSLKMLCTYTADETASYINHFFISFQSVVKIILLAECFEEWSSNGTLVIHPLVLKSTSAQPKLKTSSSALSAIYLLLVFSSNQLPFPFSLLRNLAVHLIF